MEEITMTKSEMIEWAKAKIDAAEKEIDSRRSRVPADDPNFWLNQRMLGCQYVKQRMDLLLNRITPREVDDHGAREYVKVLKSVMVYEHVRFTGGIGPASDFGTVLRECGEAQGRNMLLTDVLGPMHCDIYSAQPGLTEVVAPVVEPVTPNPGFGL